MEVFGAVDCEFDVRITNFKIADTRWRLFYSNFKVFEQLIRNLLYGYFLGRWLRFWSQNWKIQNLVSELQNSKWQIQNGGYISANSQFFRNCAETWYMVVFGVADHDSSIRITKLKMADPRWRLCDSNVEFFEQFAQNTLYGGFWSRRLQIWSQNCKFQKSGYKMATILL